MAMTRPDKEMIARGALEGARKVLGAGANAVVDGLNILTDIVYDIEVAIARYAMNEMRELFDRAMRSKGQRELQPADAARIVDEVLETAHRAIEVGKHQHQK